MTKDAWISLLVKVLLMVLTPLAAQLHINDGATLSAFAADLADAIVLLYGMYQQWDMKRIHKDAVAVAPMSGSPVVGGTVTGKVVGLLLVAFAVSAFLVPGAKAADLSPVRAINKALTSGYPLARCGVYYGFGTGGSAGAVNGAVVGTQIVQGELDALVGYTCPFATSGFWFVEGSVGFDNINGSANGLALSGPLVLMQRAGAGSPINGLFNPFGANLSMPSLPALPNGVTAGPANGYFFAGVVEQDISAQVGLDAHSHQWVIAPMIGAGLLTRLSDGVVVDTWAGWQMNSQSFCPGGGGACAKLGNAARVGVSFKY